MMTVIGITRRKCRRAEPHTRTANQPTSASSAYGIRALTRNLKADRALVGQLATIGMSDACALARHHLLHHPSRRRRPTLVLP